MLSPEEIRARIKEKLQAGTLPRDFTVSRTVSGSVVLERDIQVGVVRGYPCAGCDELDPQITYRKGDIGLRFHTDCQRIWEEERTRVDPDASVSPDCLGRV